MSRHLQADAGYTDLGMDSGVKAGATWGGAVAAGSGQAGGDPNNLSAILGAQAPLFFVLIPTKDRARLLRRALKSVQDQSHPNWEAFIIDDGATDDTGSVLSEFEDDPRIHSWAFSSSQGANAARNFLVDRIMERNQPGFIAFLDDDDAFEKDALANFATAIERWPTDQWFVARCQDLQGKSLTRLPQREPFCYLRDHKFGNLMKGEVAHVVSTELIGDIRFTTRFENAEEWWFFGELAKQSKTRPLDFVATTMEFLASGLSLSQPNQQRALEVWEAKYERWEDALPRRFRAQLLAKIARHRLLAGDRRRGMSAMRRAWTQFPLEPRIYSYSLRAMIQR